MDRKKEIDEQSDRFNDYLDRKEKEGILSEEDVDQVELAMAEVMDAAGGTNWKKLVKGERTKRDPNLDPVELHALFVGRNKLIELHPELADEVLALEGPRGQRGR